MNRRGSVPSRAILRAVLLALALGAAGRAAEPGAADLILRGGKIVTVDSRFRVVEALAVRDGRILRVGRRREIDRLGGPATRVVELDGKMVLPGLIDSHVHPSGASMIEYDHPIPEMESVADVLEYLRSRAG
jgi:predicted amidohydrolase YtcJ